MNFRNINYRKTSLNLSTLFAIVAFSFLANLNPASADFIDLSVPSAKPARAPVQVSNISHYPSASSYRPNANKSNLDNQKLSHTKYDSEMDEGASFIDPNFENYSEEDMAELEAKLDEFESRMDLEAKALQREILNTNLGSKWAPYID